MFDGGEEVTQAVQKAAIVVKWLILLQVMRNRLPLNNVWRVYVREKVGKRSKLFLHT